MDAYLAPEVRKRHLDSVAGKIVESKPPVVVASRFALPRTDFRVCPDCVREDKAQWSEPYLHREHHLPGIDFCVVHRRRLSQVGDRNTTVVELYKRMLSVSESLTEAVDFVSDDLLVHLRESVRGLFSRRIEPDERFDFLRLPQEASNPRVVALRSDAATR